MKKIFCTSILLAATGSFAATITSVNTVSGANGYQIIFKNAGVVPTTFNTTAPASIVLDFPNTTSALKVREQAINQNGVYSVNVIPGEGKTRAVLNLAKPQQYNVQLVGSDVYITLASQHITNGALFNNYSSTSVVSTTPTTNYKVQKSSIKAKQANVDISPMFHKNNNKGGSLSFTLPNQDSLVTVTTEGSNVVAMIKNYSISKKEQKRLDVADYATPVRYVDITRKGADTKVLLNMGRNPYEYVTYQNGSTYTIEVNKPSSDAQTQKLRELEGFGSNKVYTGAPLSINFQDIEVRAVLQIIAEFTNNNIVVSDSVNGNITLRLDNIPWDQALDIILKTKSLGMRKQGKVMYIAPEAELDKAEIDILKNLKEKNLLQPAHSEMIQLKYAKAADVAKILEDSRKSSQTNNNNSINNEDSILSSKGSVAVDERTNNLIISDIPSKIQAVRDLVAKLDEPVRQVLVDSRLVITSDQYEKDLGARFGLTFSNNGKGTVVGSGNLNSASYLNNTLAGGSNPSINDRLGVNLNSSKGGAASYALSILSSDVLVDLELQALQSEGRSEIISSPRVVTQDGYKALVASGQEIPYSTISDKGTETQFKDAKLSMEVTPRIAPNDRVSMEIHITKDSANTSYSVNGQPPIDTNEIDTKVEVDNGETIVLGGIYEQKQSNSVSKVPLLGDIPVIGNAFKSTTKIFNKNELLVFITPRIIDKRLADNDKFSNLRD